MNDFPVGRDSDETLKSVQAYQHFDEFSEVCPANWKPGMKTFKPTFDNASKYIEDLKVPFNFVSAADGTNVV